VLQLLNDRLPAVGLLVQDSRAPTVDGFYEVSHFISCRCIMTMDDEDLCALRCPSLDSVDTGVEV
jgi:hypothetical protein